ncbi:MAG: hypothetical protein ACI8Z7_000208, partial [Candidatus Nanohaloarchaea archaeon]
TGKPGRNIINKHLQSLDKTEKRINRRSNRYINNKRVTKPGQGY